MTVKHLKMSTSTHTNVRGKEGIKKVKDYVIQAGKETK